MVQVTMPRIPVPDTLVKADDPPLTSMIADTERQIAELAAQPQSTQRDTKITAVRAFLELLQIEAAALRS